MSDRLPIASVDFDGVLHSYRSGWKGAHVVTDGPVEGAMEWLVRMVEQFEVHVFSSRSHQPGGVAAMSSALLMWLTEDCGSDGSAAFLKLKFPDHKPPALIAIDDRAVTFTGNWGELDPELLRAFRPWTKGCSVRVLHLTGAEVGAGYDRLQYAEHLIRQLPADHQGRNFWLAQYGKGEQ